MTPDRRPGSVRAYSCSHRGPVRSAGLVPVTYVTHRPSRPRADLIISTSIHWYGGRGPRPMTELDTGTPDLTASIGDGVAVLTLSRPDRRNALSPAMLEALGATLARVEADDEVRCVV